MAGIANGRVKALLVRGKPVLAIALLALNRTQLVETP
jgi:hypothetical protein